MYGARSAPREPVQVRLPKSMRDRVIIDKFAKGVAKHGYAFEQEIIE